jgi:hypothetical protein
MIEREDILRGSDDDEDDDREVPDSLVADELAALWTVQATVVSHKPVWSLGRDQKYPPLQEPLQNPSMRKWGSPAQFFTQHTLQAARAVKLFRTFA